MDLDCHFDCGNPVVCLYYELILKENIRFSENIQILILFFAVRKKE
jgi:hypothetical protein